MLPQDFSRRSFLASLGPLALGPALNAAGDDGWIPLFDGKTLDGWTASENRGSWKFRDGALAGDGPRSHLFYTGSVKGGVFKKLRSASGYPDKALVQLRPVLPHQIPGKGVPG